MKKILCVVICVTLYAAQLSLASGIFVTPGSRANSLGGAYVGIADDVTAIYWNPAGLAQLDGRGVRVYALYGTPKAKSNTSLKNSASPDREDGDFPVLNLLGVVEPAEFQSKELELQSLLPFAGGYQKVDDVTYALGVYAIGGGGGKWEDSVPGALVPTDTVSASVDGKFGFVVTNVSAAKALSLKLSVGAGINWINMIERRKIEKEYVSPLTPYSVKTEYNASGSGFEFIGGAMYKPMDKMRVGLVIRSGSVIKLYGEAKLETTGLAAFLGNHETDYEQEYAYPMTYGLGVSYDPIEALTLAAGVEVNNYSVLKDDIDYEDEAVFSDENESKDWDNTTQLRFGTEYRFEKLVLRCGVQNDPLPFSREKMTLLDINQYDLITLNIGAGYNLGSVQVDVNYTKVFSDKPEKNGREYEYVSDTYQLGVGYKF
jgi:long-chain fatty acid transport protein